MNRIEHYRQDGGDIVELLTSHLEIYLKTWFESQSVVRIAFSGGRTPRPLLESLSQLDLPWHRAEIHLVDERWVPLDSDQSNEAMIRETFLQNYATDATLVLLPDRTLPCDQATEAHNRLLGKNPFRFDLILLGMGDDGHIASLFPADCTSTLALAGDVDTMYCATEAPSFPHRRFGMSLRPLLNSKSLILFFTGDEKREVYRQAKSDATSPHPVARIIHQNTTPLFLYWAP